MNCYQTDQYKEKSYFLYVKQISIKKRVIFLYVVCSLEVKSLRAETCEIVFKNKTNSEKLSALSNIGQTFDVSPL